MRDIKIYRFIIYTIALSFILLCCLFCFIPTEKKIIAEGVIQSNEPTIILHAFHKSLVTSINIHEGNIVKQNQLLLTLERQPNKALIASLQKELTICNDRLSLTDQQLKDEITILSMYKSLYQKKYISKYQYIRQLQKLRDIKMKMSELKLQIEHLNANYQAEITPVNSVYSPKDAVVLSLSPLSIGSVVMEGMPLITLVPLQTVHTVTTSINCKDIQWIKIGSDVSVELITGSVKNNIFLSGQVTSISPDIYQTPSNYSHGRAKSDKYLIIATLNKIHRSPYPLLPGMKVKTHIKIGKRQLIFYFIEPLMTTYRSALKEP